MATLTEPASDAWIAYPEARVALPLSALPCPTAFQPLVCGGIHHRRCSSTGCNHHYHQGSR